MAKYIELLFDEIEVLCPRCETEVAVDHPTIAITANGVDIVTDTKLSRNAATCEACGKDFFVYLHCDAWVREE